MNQFYYYLSFCWLNSLATTYCGVVGFIIVDTPIKKNTCSIRTSPSSFSSAKSHRIDLRYAVNKDAAATENRTNNTTTSTAAHLSCKKNRRPAIFAKTNVYVKPTQVPSDTWNNILPPLFTVAHHVNNNVDITVAFDNAKEGAQKLVDHDRICLSLMAHKKEQAYRQLIQCLELFQQLYEEKLTPTEKELTPIRYRARIVSSRGLAGSKCSRFHVDHVPIRLICALVGPGVVYIDDDNFSNGKRSDIDDWRQGLVNASEETDTRKVNNEILQHIGKASIAVRYTQTGDAVVLLGKQWSDRINDGDGGPLNEASSALNFVGAAAHRSPTLSPFQGRVLLTVDVIVHQT